MELSKKFQEATSCYMIQIGLMEADRKYPIHVERAITKFGKTVLPSLRDLPFKIVKVFLPKRYSSVFSYDDLHSINFRESFTKYHL